MNSSSTPEPRTITFKNVWKTDDPTIINEVVKIWQSSGIPDQEISQRVKQLVYVVVDAEGSIIGISTAFKTYVKQLRSQLYVFRCMLLPSHRIPGLTSKLVLLTRDHLESIHKADGPDIAIGVLTVVENEGIKTNRTEAVWPATQMVYIGHSKEGHHIRVYYFKGARIKP